MIATCKTCHRMFDTTEEDACHPDGTECPRCYRKARGMPPHPGPVYTGPLSLLETAIKSGCGTDQLEKLIGLQERVMDQEAAHKYGEAVTKFQQLMPPVHKGRDVKNRNSDTVRYSFAAFEDIMKVAGPILAKCGIVVSFFGPDMDDIKAGVFKITMRVRVGRYFEDKPFSAPTPDLARIAATSGGLNEAQAVGFVRSYFKRYALVDGLNITVTNEDTDAHPREPEPAPKINRKQVAELIALVSESGVGKDRFLVWALAAPEGTPPDQLRYEDVTTDKFWECKSMLLQKKLNNLSQTKKEEPKPEAKS